MPKKIILTKEQLEQAKAELVKLPSQVENRFSIEDALNELKPIIHEMFNKKGYSYDEIKEHLDILNINTSRKKIVSLCNEKKRPIRKKSIPENKKTDG